MGESAADAPCGNVYEMFADPYIDHSCRDRQSAHDSYGEDSTSAASGGIPEPAEDMGHIMHRILYFKSLSRSFLRDFSSTT